MHNPYPQSLVTHPHSDTYLGDIEQMADSDEQLARYINDQWDHAVTDIEASSLGYRFEQNSLDEFGFLDSIVLQATLSWQHAIQNGYQQHDSHMGAAIIDDPEDIISFPSSTPMLEEQVLPVTTGLDAERHETARERRRRLSQARLSMSEAGDERRASFSGRSRTSTGRVKRPRAKFNEVKRAKTKYIRTIGVCETCDITKQPCDRQILCQTCIHRHGPKALEGPVVVSSVGIPHHLPHPCADKSGKDPKIVETLVTMLLPPGHHCFPSPQADPVYFGEEFIRTGRRLEIELSLGFGPMWVTEVEQVEQVMSCSDDCQHWHHWTSWPTSHTDRILDVIEKDPILPAVFASTDGLKEELRARFKLLMKLHWTEFPKYNSPLKLLNPIHDLYKYLLGNEEPSSQEHANLLEDALIMLVMVHVAGDLSLNINNENVQSLMMLVPGGVLNRKAACCLLRAQVGAAIYSLVRELMTRVVRSALLLALDKQCKDFPIVFATFYVIFATIDSLIYHGAKPPLHRCYTDANGRDSIQQQELCIPESIQQGASQLAGVYANCYPNCHAVHVLQKEDKRPWRSKTHNIGHSDGLTHFLNQLPLVRAEAQPYLDDRSASTIQGMTDVTLLLDRLAARFVLLTVIPQEISPVH